MYDENIEKAMLYYLIFEQEEYLLDENDFVYERNKKIIKAINELKAEKQEISMLSVKSKIKANQNQILQYISSLGEYSLGTSSDVLYTKIIEMSKKRKIYEILNKSITEIQGTEEIDILGEKIIKDIKQVEKINEKEKTFIEKVVEATTEIENKTLQDIDYSLYTGILDLDKITCGLHQEELTIIGARPRRW